MISSIVLFLTFLFWIDFHNITKNALINSYNLNLPIYLKICYFTILTYHSLKTSIYQKVNGNVVKLSNHRYMLSYVIGGQLYKTIIPVRRGPSTILQVLDINANDVTGDIIPYSGLDNSFKHCLDITPVDIGYEELTINMSNGESKRIKGTDKLASYIQ